MPAAERHLWITAMSPDRHAFKQYGQSHLPSTSDRILLVINKPGASWHLTDLSTMKHYSLALQGNSIAAAPATTALHRASNHLYWLTAVPAGFNFIAQIDYLLIQAELNIQISPQQGIMAEVDLAPIVFYNQAFFALTGANGRGDPRLSLATYSRPQIANVLS